MNVFDYPVQVDEICDGNNSLAGYEYEALQKSLTTSNIKFTSELVKEIEKQKPTNYVYSPLSLQIGLGMLLLGGGKNSENEVNQIAFSSYLNQTLDIHRSLYSLMNSLGRKSDNTTIVIANRLYINRNLSVEDSFNISTNMCYNADVATVDFLKANKTSKEINDWVVKKTNGTIDKVISPEALNSNTSAVMVNAIYFHGKWKSSFNVSNTKKGDFVVINPNSSDLEHSKFIKVEMMKQRREYEHCYPTNIEAEFLKMPYESDELSMLFVLPKEIDGLQRVLKNISKFNYNECFVQKSMKHVIDVEIPKFEFNTKFNMKEVLQNVGIKDMFDSQKASFSGIGDQGFVQEMVHEAFVKVDEEGTETATITETKVGSRSISSQKDYEFHCDRPFLFMIVEEHVGTVLFLGAVTNPTEGISKA